MNFNSGKYRKMELFIKNVKGKTGLFKLLSGEQTIFEFQPDFYIFRKIEVTIQENTEYTIYFENIEISQMYLCGNEDIYETGIYYLMINNEEMSAVSEGNILDTPYREQYHFTPFVNWCNDPNGLCWFNGYYHLYYQSNPHEQVWGNMYWGHAASKDLIHWKHLPFALEPQLEILQSSEKVGGAFSGSAVTVENGIYAFFTRDAEVIGDPATIRQSQAMAFSEDGIKFINEKELIPALSLEGVDVNFRDPKVFKANDKWYMTLASNYFGKGTILLYSSLDMENWEFVRPLLQVNQENVPSLECPDFFYLNEDYVLLTSIMGYRSKYEVYQPVLYYIGKWTDEIFTPESEGVCDFGGNFYASQTFEHEGRRILIAWVCDWHKEHEVVKHGAYGSFTLPRELSVKNSCLYQKPVKEVYDLLGTCLMEQNYGNDVELMIPGNSFYGCVQFEKESSFEIVLYEDETDFLKVVGNGNMVELISSKNKDEGARFVADVQKLEKLELFIDRRMIELYVNDGEKVGTKIVVNHTKQGCFNARFDNKDAVKQIQVYEMETIWKK